MDPREEDIFVERLRQKERVAYSELYDRYSAALYGVALKMLQSEALAQDALQETFIRVWKKIHTYDKCRGRLFTWMLNILRNKCRDDLKSKASQVAAQAERGDSSISNNIAHSEEMPHKEYDLDRFLDELPGSQGPVIRLIYLGGLTHVEAAAQLDMPLGTVKSNVRLGMKRLRKIMKAGGQNG